MRKRRKRFRIFLKAIDGFGSSLCILDDLLNREKLRMVRIDGTSLYVRTNTPDLNVAISSLYKREYDHIRARSPETIIDAGANIGTSAIFFARKFPHARVIAVEPEKGNFDILLKNTSSYDNIVAVNAAIWGETGRRNIHNRFTGHWGYTVSDTNNSTESTGQDIDCITIPSLMEKFDIKTIDILKMDIEGGEKSVLENSSDWIDSVEIITAELHD
jgi:FkbM family methyltransferase